MLYMKRLPQLELYCMYPKDNSYKVVHNYYTVQLHMEDMHLRTYFRILRWLLHSDMTYMSVIQ